MFRWSLCILLVLSASSPRGFAEVTLPKILASHMVLQRGEPVHIWGWARPSEKVQVIFRDETQSATADPVGRWEVYLSPKAAGGPYDLTVQGDNKIVLDDVLVGDLWIASGQSNMEMPLQGFNPGTQIKDAAKEISQADHPDIRIVRLAKQTSVYPVDDAKLAAGWSRCTPETAKTFSAVAYFFARDLEASQKVPIGIVDTSWAATPVEAWTSMPAFGANANLMPVLAHFGELMKTRAADLRAIDLEKANDASLKAAGKPLPKGSLHLNFEISAPSGIFNAMIAPLTPLRIKGVIWYQGESNSQTVAQAGLYEQGLTTLIADWRSDWKQGNFPFLFTQLSAWGAGSPNPWCITREAQRRTLAITNTAMAVTIDIGEPQQIHPPNKQAVGARLDLAAEALAYGDRIEFSGPLFREAFPQGAAMTVLFDHAGNLKAAKTPLEGFEVAGADRKYYPASAKIEGDAVEVRSDKVASPVYVRYAWAGFPKADLYNGDDLPASPFTSDPNYFDLQ
jgi:sialate O-acetylesterase